MINLAHTCVFVTAALYVSVASASAARPVDMDKFLDRWSALDIDRCGNGEDSEEAPLQITKDKGGTSIGNYGWMCIIKSWREKAGFVVLGLIVIEQQLIAGAPVEGGGDAVMLGLFVETQVFIGHAKVIPCLRVVGKDFH